MPAQQLFDRLMAVYSDAPWRAVGAVHQAALANPGLPDWPHGNHFGDMIPDVKTMVVHETSGWPARIKGADMFSDHFLPGAGHHHDGITTQLFVSGDGSVLLGMELPRKTHHARPLNSSAIGSETGHGWGNYFGNTHLGPYSSSDDTMLPDPHHPGEFIKGPTYGAVRPLHRRLTNHWLPLSGNDAMAAPGDDDIPGVKFWVRHTSFDEVVVGLWTTAQYEGPWREPQRVPEMLFTDRQYRAWALLARYVAESLLLPRNVALLPHKTRSHGDALGTPAHGMLTDDASFAEIVLADEGLSRSPTTFGLAAGAVPAEEQLRAAYHAASPAGNGTNRLWTAVFDVFRGFHGHGFSGDPGIGDDHDCPGPMFDWYRFARELWDWWWHPFDLDGVNPAVVAVTPRPYSGTYDANTHVNEYYWDTSVAIILARRTTGIHGPHSSPSTFALPEGSRVYAMANGEVVAARFATAQTGVDFSLLVVRHEVFHRLAAAAPPGGFPQLANRIDYETAPSSVYSIYLHLGRPAGIDFAAVNPANPEWLNRMLIRMKECELGAGKPDAVPPTVGFRASPAGQAIPAATWDNFPPGTVRGVIRNSIARSWALDADNYRPTLRRLRNGDLTLMPTDRQVTPVQVILGDYLGDVGVIKRDAAGAHFGIRVEIVSNGVISTDFTETVTDAARLWDPVAGPAGTRHAVRYPSEWSQIPAGDMLATMTAAGVTDTSLATWWESVALATTLHGAWPDGSSLPMSGAVVHYDPYEFLPWLNARTWTSEWPKYRANNLANPGTVPPTPIPRS